MPVQSNINELKERILRVKANLIRNRPDNLAKIALDVLDITIERVQNRGTDYTGQSFEPYTEAYKIYGRKRQGYQTERVDFTRQGRMWGSIQPFIVESNDNRTIVEIRSNNSTDQQKLNGQFAKRGNILLPSKEEEALVIQLNEERVQKELNNL